MTHDLKFLREQIIRAASAAGEGHIASAFSILDILWVLYNRIILTDPTRPSNPNRDRFVLSKGHASLGLYGILAARGFFSMDELRSFASHNSRLGGHPDSRKVPGVEASTGSLGHGLPMAVGMAMALDILHSSSRVICLVGDGECNEGTIWEASLLASHHRLCNLTCIVDHNHSGDRALGMGELGAKFNAFGWEVTEIDGHDHSQIEHSLVHERGNRPHAVIAKTIKGYGCSEMENNPAWHHKAPSVAELDQILAHTK
jgi:transketolase